MILGLILLLLVVLIIWRITKCDFRITEEDIMFREYLKGFKNYKKQKK